MNASVEIFARIFASPYAERILSKYDPMYQILPKDDKKSYLKKRIYDISSEIEDKSDIYYSNYNFLTIIQNY